MKDKIYANYISTHFGSVHNDIEKEYLIFDRYFKKNYSLFMPSDKNGRILDLGCGMGHFLHYLKVCGYMNYLGVDISKENIEFCNVKGFNVHQADISEFLKTNQEPFDVIVMNDIIEHFTKEEIFSLLKFVNNNLANKGILIIKVPNSSNPVVGASSRYYDFTHEVSFTEESLSQILKVCGYKDVKIYPPDIYVFYFNPVNYTAKALAWLTFLIYKMLFLLYGRKTTKIFTKDLIATAKK